MESTNAATSTSRKESEDAAVAAKKEADDAAKKKADDDAAKKKAEDDAAAKKKAEDDAAAKKKAEDDDAAKKKADDNAAAAKLAAGKSSGNKSLAENSEQERSDKEKSGSTVSSPALNSPVQSSARPFSLAIADSVKLAGSDAASANFQINVLPSITNLINLNLKETMSLKNATALMLDPSQLKLATDSTIRVYFVGEGAGYHNTLAFNFYMPGVNVSDQAASRDVITSSIKLIFPDASSSVSTYDPSSKAVRSTSNPLLPGDFVDLGTFQAKGRLDLALIANGASGGKDVFVASPARNDDHITHVVSFALKNSPYLIAAFEDLRGGGDRDYNDVIVAIDIGRANVARMVSAPVPPLAWTLAALMGVSAYWRRRFRAA